jgi:hypothetical protein
MKQLLSLSFFLFILLSGSAQSGITWGTQASIATGASGNEQPRIALDRNGNPLVIWGHASRLMYSRWNGTMFTSPVMLNPASMMVAEASWMGPDIASHGDTVYIVYKRSPEDEDTCHIYCLRSFDGGKNFMSPVRVDFIGDSISRFPTITTDEAGNPVIAFMKFNPSFGSSRWVVVRSDDFGASFNADVKASGWSGSNSNVCDCCPGVLTFSGSTMAILYRDENSNIRDTWTGISNDNGRSFNRGMNIDKKNWLLMSCPASGPDGTIIGDTLYSTFMNGAAGKYFVYYNKTSVSGSSSSAAIPVTGNFTGLGFQNYPRIASSGNAVGIVWKQFVSGGGDQCLLRFSNSITKPFPSTPDTVDLGNITNADIAISGNKIFVVWEDDNTGVVRYRIGIYAPAAGINANQKTGVTVYPDPVKEELFIQMPFDGQKNISVTDAAGKTVYASSFENNIIRIDPAGWPAGLYFISIRTDDEVIVKKIIRE